jgi:DNA-binding transcriptional MocR family regulator
VKWRREWVRARHEALAGALRAHLPGWTWPEPDGGLSLWVRLPGELDSSAFAQAALRHGVAVVPGRLLSAASGAGGHIRLAFTQPPDILASSVTALARAALVTARRPRLSRWSARTRFAPMLPA